MIKKQHLLSLCLAFCATMISYGQAAIRDNAYYIFTAADSTTTLVYVSRTGTPPKIGARFNGSTITYTLPHESGEFSAYQVPDANKMLSGSNRVIIDPSISYWKPTHMSHLFHGFKNIRSIQGMQHLQTSQVLEVQGMFQQCFRLPHIDLSHFRTDNLRHMGAMFAQCESLTAIDLSHFNTSKVQIMRSVFNDCKMLKTITLNNFDGRSLFAQPRATETMFGNCINLEYIDMHQATNFATERINTLLQTAAHKYTLLYMPPGNYTGREHNVITPDNKGGFVCNKYVLSDDTLTRYIDGAPNVKSPEQASATAMRWELNIPYAFKTNIVENTRTVGASTHAYTWYMPYSAPIPTGVRVYEFAAASVTGIEATFVPTKDTYLHAQKPYLIRSQVGAIPTSVSPTAGFTSEIKQYTPGNDVTDAYPASGEWAYIGTFQWRTAARAAEENLYTLQPKNFWKHYQGSTANPRPLRGFLKKATAGGATTLSAFFEDNAITAIERITLLDHPNPENSRIYDLNGRYLGTRKELLTPGLYIIGGQKTAIQ